LKSEKTKEPLADIIFSPESETGVPLPRPDQDLEALTLLLAGVDTTAGTGALTVWEMIKHPDVVAKLQEELDGIFPNVSVESNLSINDAESGAWMTACLKEGMRIHPAFPGPLLRVVPAGGTKLAGFAIPRDVCAAPTSVDDLAQKSLSSFC